MTTLAAPLFRRPWLFWSGLAINAALILFAVPQLAADWFVPFVEGWLAAPSLDPWTRHLGNGGAPAAFPYGPGMLLALLPTVGLGALAKALTGYGGAAVVGYGVAILAAEIACLMLLSRLQKGDTALACLWLSPAVIVLSFWHGQNDLIPVALLVASLFALRRYAMVWSGVALGLAIATKLSMALAAPFVIVYLYRNTRLRGLLPAYLAGLAGPVALQLIVFACSPGARAMILGTPEAQKIFDLALPLGQNTQIYVLPIVYMMMLFWEWRLRRITFDLAVSVIGIAFLLVCLLTPATPNWFIWAAPFLALHAGQTGSRGLILVIGLSALKMVSVLLLSAGAVVPLLGLDLTAPLGARLGLAGPHAVSILFSVIVALGLFIASRIWRNGVRRNELYRISRRPLVIGIAGDSGSGKDTLALALAGMFGEQAVASVSGDDYHRWDRARPMWSAMTHLNPRANDLERMTNDVLALAGGRAVSARHYDHKTGRFTKPRKIAFNDVILVSGLHALAIGALRSSYDVSIYLDMDEELRRHLKIRRDVHERGHSEDGVRQAIEHRRADAQRFVNVQHAHADVVFALAPANRERLADATSPMRLKLTVTLRGMAPYETLVRQLISTCGMQVDVDLPEGSEAVALTIEGDIDRDDVAIVAASIVPHLDELVALKPNWHDGMTGLMQLIVLSRTAHALRVDELTS